MTPEEVTRRNEAIALYMEWQRSKAGAWFNEPMMKTGESSPPPFHERYDLLMPVVDKIVTEVGVCCYMKRDIYDELVGGEFMFTLEPDHYGSYAFPTVKGFGKTSIGAIWMAVSDYAIAQQPRGAGNETMA